MTAPRSPDFRPHPHLTVRVEHRGREREPAVVIDDFLAEPQALVDVAAAGGRFAPVRGNLYPGIRAPLPAAYLRVLVGCLQEPVRKVFGLSDVDLARVEGDFSIVTTPPQQLQLLQCLPHFDTTDGRQVAVLHYLCAPALGGTSFYRHRSSGYETIDVTRHDGFMAALGAELKQSGPPARYYMQGSNAIFERIGALTAAFNRLVIYRSATLHSGDIPADFRFDPNPRTGRLTANTFLRFRSAARTG